MSGQAALVALALSLAPLSGAPPAWLDLALARLPAPSGAWPAACTLEIERNGQRSVEHFDPLAPPAAQWTLVERQGQAPSPEELAAYRQSRAAPATTPAPAGLVAQQIDRASLELVRESATHATLTGGFTEEAAATDKLLGRLTLTLLVRKDPAAVVYYRLELRQPFSPVLGVRMHELDAGAVYDAEGSVRRSWSRFRGRVFLRPVVERVTATFAPPGKPGSLGNRN